MSFILDALKKSESDRQRHNGPGLYEAKLAAPRTQLPLWAIGLAVLLGINVVIVAWALLKRPPHPATMETAAAVQATPQPPPAAGATPPAANEPLYAAAQRPIGAGQPESNAPEAASPSAPAPQSATLQGDAPARHVPGAQASGSLAAADTTTNPDDLEPAAEPSSGGAGFHARQGTVSGVPLYSQSTAANGTPLPQLRLDLHAYAARPEERFVLINMKRLREGDSLPEGVKVESITPDGVILSHLGARFLLPRN